LARRGGREKDWKSPISFLQHDADESTECLRCSRQNKNKHRNKIIPSARSRSTARKLYEKSHQNQFELHTKIFSISSDGNQSVWWIVGVDVDEFGGGDERLHYKPSSVFALPPTSRSYSFS
jgi:hypothetical protein